MKMSRTISRLVTRGVVVGSVVSVLVPAKGLVAGCKCDDDLTGAYQCNSTQTACVAGTHQCDLHCS